MVYKGKNSTEFEQVFSKFATRIKLPANMFNENSDDWYNLLKFFCKRVDIDYENVYTELVKNPKVMHMFVCYLKNLEIKNDPLNFKKNSEFGSVIIEDRVLPHLECIIRNTILKTPNNWSHSVVCTKMNSNSIKELCKRIHPDIKVIPVEIPNFTQNTYNNMLLNKWFWDKIDSENILIYQQDSFLFREGIEEFYEYDYIGAPWMEHQTDNEFGVGNGGFSFRKKSKILKCLETINPKNIELSSDTLNYMRNVNLQNPPEDVYFSKAMIEYNIGKVANREVASKFSEERIASENSLGGHQYWLANCEEMFRLFQPFKMQDWSYFEGEASAHRGGWKSLISYMLKNNVLKRDCGVPLLDVVEKYFVWDKNPAMECSWVGISHMTPNTPDYLSIADIDRLVENENFVKSLPLCKAFIVLSDYIKEYLTEKLNNICNVNIVSLKHPVSDDIKHFNIQRFYQNNQKKVILLGQQMRKISSIYLLKTNRKKWWMYGHPDVELMHDRRNNELKMLNQKPNVDNVEMVKINNNAEYDKIISENIILMDFIDASANNAILECISGNIPFFTKRLPAIEEYLGKDYPMYFEELSDIEDIINNDSKLKEIYTQTNSYLLKLDKTEFHYSFFCKKLLELVN